MKNPQKTRLAIIESSKTLFMKKNINNVTVNEIVKKAGVAKGTFYLHFESKETLVWTIIDEIIGVNSLDIDLFSYNYSEQQIRKLITDVIHLINQRIQLLKIIHKINFFSFLGIKKVEKKYLGQWVKTLTLWLERGVLEKKLYTQNPNLMAEYLVSSIHTMIDKILLEEIPFSIPEFENFLKSIITPIIKFNKQL